MGRPPRHRHPERDHRRRLHRRAPDASAHVEHIGLARKDPRKVEQGAPADVDLLRDREQHLDAAVRETGGTHGADPLEDLAEPGGIVRAKDSGPVRGQAAVIMEDRTLVSAGRHGVHVRGEEKRRPGERACKIAIEIPGVPAELGACVVLKDSKAEITQHLREGVGIAAFVETLGAPGGESEECGR